MTAALFDLGGRAALVTGSTRGLGLAIARALAQAGASVALNGRSAETVALRVAELAGEGLAVRAAPFDASDEDEVAAAAAALGPLDVLVNNVGITLRKPLEQVSPGEWRQVLETNLTSAFLVSRAVVGAMLERGSGKIVNVCSVQSELARATIAPYSASKGGLKLLTRAMCADWGGRGIQVNGIAPGYFVTDLTAPLRADPEFDAWVRRRVPAGRWGEPGDLAGAAVFLASGASDFVNGQVLFVDGGLTAVV